MLTQKSSRNSDLFTLMKCVNKSIPDKSLPLASQMDFLNTARAKIKHHASVPSIEDTQRCHIHAKDFLEQVTEDYLDTNFLSVSRLLLIKNSIVRQHLEEADKQRNEGNYLEALIEVKKAFYSARPSDQVFVSKDAFFSGFFLTSGFRDIEDLQEPIEKIIDKIIELENNVALVMMGIDVLKLRKFEEITPHFTFYTNGGCSILWKNSVTPTEEMVEEAVNFVTDMTLQWERMGVIANRPGRNRQLCEL